VVIENAAFARSGKIRPPPARVPARYFAYSANLLAGRALILAGRGQASRQSFNLPEGEMPILKNYPVAQQAVKNSCWACAARSIVNFSAGKSIYDSDQALADAYAAKSKGSKNPGSADINEMQSAADALYWLGFKSNIDEAPIPTADELIAEFKNNKPVLSIVGADDPKGKPNKAYQKGHWVVLIGISDDKKTLTVFDPGDGKSHMVAYDAATYGNVAYWENSSYF
jgi:hypothetical protein